MDEMKEDNILEMKMVSKEVYDGEEDDFEVEFEISPALETNSEIKACRDKINEGLSEVDAQLDTIQKKIDDLNKEIDRLTNNADVIDYMASVICGLISGIMDITLVGEWNFAKAKAESNKKINSMVIEFAEKDPDYPYKGTKVSNPLEKAIEFLEKKYKLPGDNSWNVKGTFINAARKLGFNGRDYNGAIAFMNENFPRKGGWSVADIGVSINSHHLDDICHHPTLIGLICNIIVQFTGESIYYNSSSEFIRIAVNTREYGPFASDFKYGKVFAGIVNWFFNVAETMKNWQGHLMSDIAGTSSAAKRAAKKALENNSDFLEEGGGDGIAGVFLSTAKEISMLPCFKDSDFAQKLADAYQHGIGTGKNQVDLGAFNSLFQGASSKFDVRTENAVASELGRQSQPILLNEIFVRAFYFVRRFIDQMKEKKSLRELEWGKIIPFRNRTIVRMVTIASGTFEAVDMAEAAISAARKSGGVAPAFWSNFVLKVNFVGVGRFAVAVLTDVGMGVKREVKVNERIEAYSQQRILFETKVFYKDADNWCDIAELYEKVASMYDAEAEMWSETEKTEVATEELLRRMKQVVKFYNDSMEQLYKDLFEIAEALPEAEKKNPGITQIILGED